MEHSVTRSLMLFANAVDRARSNIMSIGLRGGIYYYRVVSNYSDATGPKLRKEEYRTRDFSALTFQPRCATIHFSMLSALGALANNSRLYGRCYGDIGLRVGIRDIDIACC